jgi:FAD synthetase
VDGFILSGSALFKGSVKLPVTKSRRIVLVGGCFDVIHHGHLSFLKKAKEEGDVLIVALENDEFIRKQKKRNPFHTQSQRADMLSSFRAVDGVISLPTMDSDECYKRLVETVKPSVVAVTQGDLFIVQKRTYAQSVGAKVKIVCKLIEGLSSSTITDYARILHD